MHFYHVASLARSNTSQSFFHVILRPKNPVCAPTSTTLPPEWQEAGYAVLHNAVSSPSNPQNIHPDCLHVGMHNRSFGTIS